MTTYKPFYGRCKTTLFMSVLDKDDFLIEFELLHQMIEE